MGAFAVQKQDASYQIMNKKHFIRKKMNLKFSLLGNHAAIFARGISWYLIQDILRRKSDKTCKIKQDASNLSKMRRFYDKKLHYSVRCVTVFARRVAVQLK